MTRSILMGTAYGAMAGAFWGITFLAPELVAPFTPFQLATLRYLTFGIVSLLILLPRLKTLLPHLTFKAFRALVLLAILGSVGYYSMMGVAIQLSGVAMPSLIIGFIPVTVTLAGICRHNAVVTFRQLIPSILLSTAGILCISWQNFFVGSALHHTGPLLQAVGLLMAIGSLLGWTLFNVINSDWLKKLDHITSDEWNLLTGVMAGILSLVILLPAAFFWPTHLPTTGWTRFILISCGVGLFSSTIANAFWNRMTHLLPLTMVGQMILFETLFSLIYGFLWEQRLPTIWEAAAFLLSVSGVLACVRAHKNNEASHSYH
ncbi:DMT family transporter [Parasaccharibacter sp. TMW 2.1886]|nr:DMT family transporter [Parasaccharibacter sp. TMW 2.1886]